jgi:hypothetical protein
MPLAGVVVNRVNRSTLDISAERALALAEDLDPDTFAVENQALRQHADLVRVIEQERLLLDRFATRRPTVARTLVTALPSDVTDVNSLRRVGSLLAEQD